MGDARKHNTLFYEHNPTDPTFYRTPFVSEREAMMNITIGQSSVNQTQRPKRHLVPVYQRSKYGRARRTFFECPFDFEFAQEETTKLLSQG